MIDIEEVLEMLNRELHGRIDYTLFSNIFDAVADIVPEGYVVVKVINSNDIKEEQEWK